MLIRSVRYPQLRVHVGGANVKFHDGVAEVSDEIAAALLELPSLDLELAEGESTADADSEDDSEVVDESEGESTADADSEDDSEVVDESEGESTAEKRKPGRPKKS